MKYTQGPWNIDETEDTLFLRAAGKLDAIVAQVELNSEICSTADEVEPNQQRANAHLLAAAPDMYEILKTLSLVVAANGQQTLLLADLNRVLAKANGVAP